MKTIGSFLEFFSILFILCWLFGCSCPNGFEKEASVRHNFIGGETYSVKLTPRK